MKLYALKDVKAAYFLHPWMVHNDAEAERVISGALNDPRQNPVKENPADYELWRIAEFDEESGIIQQDLSFVISAANIEVRTNADDPKTV